MSLKLNSCVTDDQLADHIRKATGWSEKVTSPTVVKRYYRKLRKERRTWNNDLNSQLFSSVPVKVPRTPRPKLGQAHPDYVKDDDFYKSREWRELRYMALVNCDGRCQCCGASQKDGIVLHVDHIQPRYKFPMLSLILANLQVLCEDCNIGKGAWDSTDWRVKME